MLSTHGDIDTIIDEGNRNRTVAATKMNAESSRSHSILQLKVIGRFSVYCLVMSCLLRLARMAVDLLSVVVG